MKVKVQPCGCRYWEGEEDTWPQANICLETGGINCVECGAELEVIAEDK